MKKYVQDILKECELRGLSEDTKKAYTMTLEHFVKFHKGHARISVEKLFQKRFFPFVLVAIAIVRISMVLIAVLRFIVRRRSQHFRLRRWSCRCNFCRCNCFFNNFIEFPTVEPNASALRAKIDFNTLSLGH